MTTVHHDDSTATERVQERFDRPFSYDEATRRLGLDEASLKGALGALVAQDELEKATLSPDQAFNGYSDEAVDLLVDLRTYLDETDQWHVGGAFPNPSVPADSDYVPSAAFQEDIDGWDDAVYDELVAAGAISRHGGIDIITDEGWTAIYAATGEEVYDRVTDGSADTTFDTPYPRD